ncbi:hypothetical protein KI387_037410, partial [Taxus chinensis]
MEMTRSMLKGKNLSNKYWAEAVACAVYILNRSPTKIVMNMIPQQAWSGKHHSVSHFRIFGCIANAHVPKETRSKLDDKSENCIFIGYDKHSKAYKLFNPITKKVVLSRDVVFKEEESWDGNIEKTISHTTTMPYEDQKGKSQGHQGEQEEQSNQQEGISEGESSQIQVEQGESSRPQLSNESNPTVASLRPRLKASLDALPNLQILRLQNNSLQGEIPSNLASLSEILILNIADNRFKGEILEKLGMLTKLRSLHMGKNNLQGLLPSTLRNLSYLQVLDVGENNLTGNIPGWIANCSSLRVLVMRSNNFEGKLPPQISQMEEFQILDISSNLLFGQIPSQLGLLDSLGYLNLPYNNLSGRIPRDGHMLTFYNSSSYLGNPHLWGCPLERNCSLPHLQQSAPPVPTMDDEEERDEGFPWFWMCFGLAVGMGFSTVVMVLTLH